MRSRARAIEQFEAACRIHGLPVTLQRRRIFEALLERTDHPTPDQVYATVKKTVLPGVSRTTVYRVLDTLVRLGVLARACSPSAATRVDPRTARHHHLVCQRCDRLFDVEDAAVHHRVRPPDVRSDGFEIQDYSIYFSGLCAACRAQVSTANLVTRTKTGRPRTARGRTPSSRRPPFTRG